MVYSFADGRRRYSFPLEYVTIFNYIYQYPEFWQEPKIIRLGGAGYTDLFSRNVSNEYIREMLAVVSGSPQHTFEVITKSPHRMRSILRSWVRHEQLSPNLHIGVTARHQHQLDRRLSILLTIPASVCFVSCEALQGPVDLGEWLYPKRKGWTVCPLDKVFIDADRPNQKPRYREWLNMLRCQCQDAGVACIPQRWNATGHLMEQCR